MKIFVTGGTGYIGSRLTDSLKRRAHDVKTLGLENSADIKADVTDFGALKEGIRGFDAIYHLAAKIGVSKSFDSPKEYFAINADGTKNILEASRLNDIKQIIFTSSIVVYGKPQYLPIDENHPTSPTSPYGQSKLMAEKFCKEYSDNYGFKITILRIGYLYGPAQSNLFFPTVISQLNNDKITVQNLDFKLDYVFIDDVVSALVKSLDMKKSNLFNIGFGKSISGRDVIDTLSEIVGRKIIVETINPRHEEEEVMDISKAKKVLKWKPEINLERGLRKILASISS